MSMNATVATGIYSVREAARLTRVHPSRIRRWVCGYDYRRGDRKKHSEAVWKGQISPEDGVVALGFFDLLEVRFVAAFINAGVSWRTMREAHALAARELGSSHPFCTNRFVTDGRRILMRHAEVCEDSALLDIVSRQQEFSKILAPFIKELEFDEQQVVRRWWPLGRERGVVLDPDRNFGQPTVALSGVPTQILARSLKANAQSVELVARWYEVSPKEITDALDFEQSLAA
jgi:uncharacterized protein (DUF433 family)